MDPTSKPSKSLYIVKGKPDSLSGAESWLKGKGWSVESSTSIKDALANILKMKPAYILICMDHPNPKVRMLPKLFETAFQTKVIAYLEATSAASIATISGMDYVLYPPISGTAVDRMVGKVERDARRKAELQAMRASTIGKASLGTSNDAVIAIKGDAKTAEDKVTVSQKARAKLTQLMQAEAAPERAAVSQAAANSSAPKASGISNEEAAKALHDMLNGSAKNDGADLKFNLPTGQGREASEEKEAPRKLDSKGRTISTNETPLGKLEAAAEKLSKIQDALEKKPKSQDADAKAERAKSALERGAQESATSATPDEEKSGGLFSAAKAAIRALANRGKTITHMRPKSALTEDSPIVENTQKAIDETAQMESEKDPSVLGECKDLICFFVHSERYHGYVLCAIASGQARLSDFVGAFKQKLIQLMANSGEVFSATDALDLRVQNVKFEEWAKHEAEFMKKFPHDGCECVIAYFAGELPPPTLHPAQSKDMISMSIDEVHGDRHLEFDLFLHMPLNKKFIRYGRKQRKFSKKQKKRLVSRGIAIVHLPEGQMKDLLRYRLQAFLDQKITLHKETVQQKDVSSF